MRNLAKKTGWHTIKMTVYEYLHLQVSQRKTRTKGLRPLDPHSPGLARPGATSVSTSSDTQAGVDTPGAIPVQ